MTDIMKRAEGQLAALVKTALCDAMEAGALPQAELLDFKVEIPADRKNGDYSTNIAMVHARQFRTAPIKIANTILERMDLSGSYFSHAEAAGAGFLNFTLSPSYYADTLLSVEEAGEKYGCSDLFKGKRALVEFVSANPTGPMHIGNARGGALGDSLAEVLSRAGYETEREFYINDGGNQIEKFGLSLDIRYRQHFGDPVEMPEDSYHGQDIIDHAAAFAEIHGDKYLHVSEAERRQALIAYALPLNIAGLERDLKKYKITYDTWFKESTLHESGKAAKMVELLTEKGWTYELDGAVWFKAEQFGCEKDFVLRRSNGFYTYIVPDIAYHYNKLCERGFDLAVDVLGADHHGYVPRLKAALTALGVDAEKLQVVLMQMVNLVRNGETVKLSKRSGKAITLVTLLDEVPIDAARFFFNMREANTHCDFDLDLAVEQSSQNPVYYCQYAHARICSIFRKMEESGTPFTGCTKEQALLLTAAEEKELIRYLSTLPTEVESAAKALDPSRMTRYAMELSSLFHKFYNACRCNVEDADLRAARLFLCRCTRTALANVLGMLKVDAPENM
ncbi:MAG: arginine--tRNA ligase [Clostridia bacterium]|nr:arginine--tRNA ligase [Clostridia bacterium]